MHGGDLFNRFDFNHQGLLYQQVNPECSGESHAIELNIDWLLPVNTQTRTNQISRKDGFVDALKQTRTKLAMDLDCRIDHFSAYAIYLHCSSPRLRASA